MRQYCRDEFEHFQLPFQTFFNPCTNHEVMVHDEMEFIWLFEGEISIQCEGKSFLLTPNHVFMIYMGHKHAMTSTEETVSIAFRLNKNYINQLNLYFDRIPFINRIYSFHELAYKYHEVPLIMSQLILLMKSTTFDPHIHYRLLGYYNMYLYDLYSVRMKDRYLDIKKKNYDKYLLRFYTINDYIQKNYHKKIRLSELAQLVNISPDRLTHFIKEIMGITLQEYLLNIRLEKALSLLKSTSLPIQTIVTQCGFSDQKYLNQAMKDRFHVTAFSYRKIMSDDEHFGIDGFSYPQMIDELSDQLHHIQQNIHVTDTFGLSRNILDTKQSFEQSKRG